jgi:hypothetical protein
MISEIPVGVKENLLESRDYFFVTSSGFPLPRISTLCPLWGADLLLFFETSLVCTPPALRDSCVPSQACLSPPPVTATGYCLSARRDDSLSATSSVFGKATRLNEPDRTKPSDSLLRR